MVRKGAKKFPSKMTFLKGIAVYLNKSTNDLLLKTTVQRLLTKLISVVLRLEWTFNSHSNIICLLLGKFSKLHPNLLQV